MRARIQWKYGISICHSKWCLSESLCLILKFLRKLNSTLSLLHVFFVCAHKFCSVFTFSVAMLRSYSSTFAGFFSLFWWTKFRFVYFVNHLIYHVCVVEWNPNFEFHPFWIIIIICIHLKIYVISIAKICISTGKITAKNTFSIFNFSLFV